jgi:hypothetical protein
MAWYGRKEGSSSRTVRSSIFPVEEARAHLRTAIRLFLEEAQKMGTLETILQESGFKKTAQGWQAPRLVGG